MFYPENKNSEKGFWPTYPGEVILKISPLF